MTFMTAGSLHGMTVRVLPERIALKAGEYKRIPVYLFVPEKERGTAELTLEASQPFPARIVRSVSISAASEVK
jgi:hypothetical protein